MHDTSDRQETWSPMYIYRRSLMRCVNIDDTIIFTQNQGLLAILKNSIGLGDHL